MRPLRVLVVDRQTILLDYIRCVLCSAGYATFTACCAEQAFGLLSHGIDLVISDMDAPLMGGPELIAEVARRSPRTMGLLMTASPHTAAALGMPFLQKPFTPNALLAKVAEVALLGSAEPQSVSVQRAAQRSEAAKPKRSKWRRGS